MGKSQNMDISGTVEEVDSNSLRRLWNVEDVSGGSNCRCGGNSKRTRIRSGTWRCNGIAVIS